MFTTVATVIRDARELEKISKMTINSKGSEVKFIDAGFETQKKVLNRIVEAAPDVYGVTTRVPRTYRPP
jgi:hypothetical protein